MLGRVGAGVRRRSLSWPLFGLSLGVLIVGSGAAQAAGPVLPTGGKVVAGKAVIGAPFAGALTINQTSSKAIITWNGFSIGQGGTVQINNASGATLNRVTGTTLSTIEGLLSGTGSVYLINPNGVIIGKSGVVNVGGTFVASTLDVTNANFLAGDDLTFSGASPASVINLGKVGSLGGDVALIAAEVANAGSINAANGTAGLVSGYSVLMRDTSLDDGKFSVLVGGAGTSVTNSGVIAAANAELRAEQGNIYALAGDTAGVIRATGVKSGDGHVWLVADQGALDLGGTIAAQGAGGSAGAIETSGNAVSIGQAKIDAHGGAWTLDPNDLTIDATAASTIDNALNGGTSVTQSTSASGTGGSGDITVAAPISWTTNASLTLSAYRNVDVNASISSSGGGVVTFYADNTGTGAGTVSFGSGAAVSTSGAVNIFYNPASNPAGSVVNTTSYTNPTNYAANVTGGGTLTAYMLVNSVYDLQNISNNLAGSSPGTFALGRDIDASAASSWNNGSGFSPIGYVDADTATGFDGLLNGQGHSITGLTINAPSTSFAGLFGYISPRGVVENVNLIGGAITGDTYVGALAGGDDGQILNITSNASVSGGEYTGGLVGRNGGAINSSFSDAKVSSTGSYVGGVAGVNDALINVAEFGGIVDSSGPNNVGGITGYNGGTINNSYNVGRVAGSAEFIGGIAGLNAGNVVNVYSSSVVSGNVAGAIVGVNSSAGGVITNAYWDRGGAGQSTSSSCLNGQCTSSQSGYGIGANYNTSTGAVTNLTEIGGSTGLSPYAQSTYSGFDFSASGPWVIFEGLTRPMLKSEYSTTVTNAHQLQLMALNPSATYTLASDIDASGTTNPSDVWNAATGFVPVGTGAQPFSGVFNGAGHTVSGLTIDQPNAYEVGLFGVAGPTSLIESVAMSGGSVTGNTYVGGLVGLNQGTLSGVSTAATVSATNAYVGGVAGYSSGTVLNSAANGLVSGPYYVGGLVGLNDTSGVIFGGYATGAVGGNTYVGGVAGSNAGTISGAGSQSPVAGTGAWTGGAAGYNSGLLLNVGAYGSVSGGYGVGGLAGGNAGTVDGGYASAPINGGQDVGGVAGVNSGTVVLAGAASNVTATQANAGGAVGDNTGSIQDVVATGQVSAPYQAGGLIGFNEQGATASADGAQGAVSGTNNIGGLVGLNGGTVSGAYANGSAAATGAYAGGGIGDNLSGGAVSNVYASGPVSGAYGAGGVAGRNDGQMVADIGANAVSGATDAGGLVGVNTGSVSQSFAVGAVYASNAYAGGLVGYNSGSVSDAYSTGAVSGNYYVGGLLGRNDGQVARAYATGAVSGNAYAAGVVGYNTGSASSVYWDVGTTGASTGVGFEQNASSDQLTGIGGSTGLNPYAQATYRGFDFTDTWTIQQGQTRPVLQANAQSLPPG